MITIRTENYTGTVYLCILHRILALEQDLPSVATSFACILASTYAFYCTLIDITDLVSYLACTHANG